VWYIVDPDQNQPLHGTIVGDLAPGEVIAIISDADGAHYLHHLQSSTGSLDATLSVGCGNDVYPHPEPFMVLVVEPPVASSLAVQDACSRAPLSSAQWARIQAASRQIGFLRVKRELPSKAATTPPATTAPPATTPPRVTTPPPASATPPAATTRPASTSTAPRPSTPPATAPGPPTPRATTAPPPAAGHGA
jgi:hypothetical protein